MNNLCFTFKVLHLGTASAGGGFLLQQAYYLKLLLDCLGQALILVLLLAAVAVVDMLVISRGVFLLVVVDVAYVVELLLQVVKTLG